MSPNIWFTSDLHLGHRNIVSHCNRPFLNAEEMDVALVKNWNDRVQPKDMVYCLGDLVFRNQHSKTIPEYLAELNGHIWLIIGNHDYDYRGVYKADKTGKIFGIDNLKTIKIEGQKLVLCHYPMLSWEASARKSWHLYGHVHNSPFTHPRPNTLNVGVDLWNFCPISYEMVKEKISYQIEHFRPNPLDII